MQEQIFDMLLKEDEITWQTIIYDLVKSHQMDPWDVDISMLTKQYISILKKLKEMDCRISGKVLLAAAILLKIKSKRLIDDDLGNLDRLISSINQAEDEAFYDDLEAELFSRRMNGDESNKPKLIPRTPQPRKRKVSIFDLMEALEQALEVKKRRVIRSMPPSKVMVPKKGVDLTHVMKQVYSKIISVVSANGSNARITFTNIIPSDTKEGKVLTFIPLLHLTNQRKVDIFQEQHAGEIEIELLKKMTQKQIDKELAVVE